MKAEILLTLRYIKKHKKQFFASVLCIAVFSASICAVQLFKLSMENSTREERMSQTGRIGGYSQNADVNKLSKQGLDKWDAGVIYITGEAQTDYDSHENTTYLGYMDQKAKDLQKLLFKKGGYPKSADEAAVTDATYKALKLKIKPGEQFTLRVLADGKAVTRQYTLSGVLTQYPRDSWVVMPQVLTGENPAVRSFVKVNVVYGVDTSKYDVNLFGGGVGYATFTDEQLSPNEQIVNGNTETMSTVLTAFFILLVLLGVYTVVKITFKDRERHIGLLRCIGMTKAQAVLALLLQGLIIAVCAVILNGLLGAGFAYLAALLMQAIGYPFFTLVISPDPFVLSSVICGAVVLLAFLFQAVLLVRKKVFEYGAPAKVRRKNRNTREKTFLNIWIDANSRTHSVQNRLSVVLIAGCVTILLFGTFAAEFSALQRYYGMEQNAQKYSCDYEINMGMGSNATAAMNTNFPRESGVNSKNIGALQKTEGLKVDSYAVDDMCNAWILYSKKDANEATERYYNKKSHYSEQGSKEKQRKYLTNAGYAADQDLISQKFTGLDYSQLMQSSDSLKEGAVNQAAYTQGKEVVAFGDGFKAGDKFTVTVPVYSPDAAYQKELTKPVIHNIEVTVAAVCSTKNLKTPFMKQMANAYPNWIVMSDKLLMELDGGMRYDYVALSYTGDRGNMDAVRNAENVIETVIAQSTGVQLTDYINLSGRWDAAVRQQQVPVFVLVGLFLLIIFLALTLSNDVKIKSSLKSYALLRAIGLDKKQLLKTVFYSTLRICMLGAVIGVCLGFAASTFIYVQYGHGIPIIQVLLTAMLPVAVIGIVLIAAISLLSCLRPVSWVIKQDITASINTVNY